MFLIWVEKEKLHQCASPGLLVSRREDLSFRVLAKEVQLPAGAVLRQAYPGEPAPMSAIRAWVETEGPVIADGVEIK
jgi:hypothetical protein